MFKLDCPLDMLLLWVFTSLHSDPIFGNLGLKSEINDPYLALESLTITLGPQNMATRMPCQLGL